jgi:tetratricopeptide (TPR) repeat protein
MVRDWYRATAAWMQYYKVYDLEHLNHARELFPEDADILFLCATQHETYASPVVQALMRTVILPAGYTLEPLSAREERRRAEALLRRAIATNPDLAEAHLRLGRLLAIEAQYADAERELALSLEGLEDPENRYYAHLFLGAIQEATHQYHAAQATFARAADLFPDAQSPWLALAELARTRGDRAGALRAMQRVYALPPDGAGRDPWWVYRLWQARDADRLMDDVRRPFLEVDR